MNGPLIAAGTYYRVIPDWKQLEMRRGYYAGVSLVDKQVGRILDTLEETGLRNSTLVLLWGDHGYQLGEKGEWGKFTCFELGARVPLMISLPPGIQHAPGSISNALVELLDVFPTLVEAANLPAPPQQLHGQSLLPLMEDPARMAFKLNVSFSQYPRNGGLMGTSMRSRRNLLLHIYLL